jgi:hypothetical protein
MVEHIQINKCNTARKTESRTKKHVIISIYAEEAFDRMQHNFMIKALKKVEIGVTVLNIIKAVYDQPIANIVLNREKLKPFPLKSGTRQECSRSSSLEFLTRAIR